MSFLIQRAIWVVFATHIRFLDKMVIYLLFSKFSDFKYFWHKNAFNKTKQVQNTSSSDKKQEGNWSQMKVSTKPFIQFGYQLLYWKWGFFQKEFCFHFSEFWHLIGLKWFLRLMHRGYCLFFGVEFKISGDFWLNQCDTLLASWTTPESRTNHFH